MVMFQGNVIYSGKEFCPSGYFDTILVFFVKISNKTLVWDCVEGILHLFISSLSLMVVILSVRKKA